MALEVVWDNPIPPLRVEHKLERIELDPDTSICIARSTNSRIVFELTAGGLDMPLADRLDSLGGA